MRTSLTVLGVIIGTSAIVLMLSLGFAMNINLENSYKQWGNISVIDVWPSWNNYDGRSSEYPSIKQADIDRIEKIPNVELVIPMLRLHIPAAVGRYNGYVDIVGTTPKAMEILGYEVERGRVFQEGDGNVMIAGNKVATQFSKDGSRRRMRYDEEAEAPFEILESVLKISFNSGGNSEQKVKAPRAQNVTVVGVLKGKNYENTYRAYMPVEAVQKLIQTQKDYEDKVRISNGEKVTKTRKSQGFTYDSIQVKVVDVKQVEAVQEQIRNLGMEAYSMADGLNQMKQMFQGIQMVLGGIGAVSLLIAALGITNTMIMSIYERTREIGIMKVIGALIADIKKMFLIEAAMIGFIGGLLGIGISLLISYLLNNFGSQQGLLGNMFMSDDPDVKNYVSVIPIWLFGASLVFSSLVGIVAGYFPARKAMKLSALSAIKTE